MKQLTNIFLFSFRLLFLVNVFCMAISSCAKMPIQAVELSHALKDEGQRMHEMNLALVDYVFNEKKHLIQEFIKTEYTPAVLENFKTLVPASTDFRKDFLDIMQAINPRIDARRDSLLQALQDQKRLVTDKLNTDYKVYNEAFGAMQNLLVSAGKLNQQREGVYQNIKSLSNNRINLQGIDHALNQFILGAGAVSEKSMVLGNAVQTFLK